MTIKSWLKLIKIKKSQEIVKKKHEEVAYKDCDFLRRSEAGWRLRLLTTIVRSQQVDLSLKV